MSLSSSLSLKMLRKLAAAHGVLTSYYGVNGLAHASPDAVLSVLKMLGAPVARIEDAGDALRAFVNERAERLLEPVVVAWDDGPHFVSFRDPADGSAAISARFLLEDGTTLESGHETDRLPTLSRTRGRVMRSLPLPDLPFGYHRLGIEIGSHRAEALVLRAPRSAYRAPSAEGDHGVRRKGWGLFVPLYGVTSEGSWGSGDFSDLGRLVDLVARHDGDFVATLPLLATFLDEPSPYSPVSRRFWNELYVDPRLTPEWASLGSPDDSSLAKIDALRTEPLLDLEELSRLKRPMLQRLARAARKRRPEEFEIFARVHPEATDYARFRAASERRKRRWRSWAEPPPARDFADHRFLYHFYAQMVADEQLSAAHERALQEGVRFYFDLPLGVHRDGFDTWRHPSLFAHDADVGAPPDPVFVDGQSWGFPPLVPEKSREEGHASLRGSLHQIMRHADVLRIDHVMGLHRQFWIPAGFEKRDGVYVRYPAEELYALLSLESHRHRCEIVGENLGIVPERVGRCLDLHAFRGIYVLQFGLTGERERPMRDVPRGAVASLNTHDTPTLAGFSRARDLEERVEAGLVGVEEAEEIARRRQAAMAALDEALGVSSGDLRERLERWLGALFASEAELVMMTLEDLWLEEAPQNVPGRMDLPNWRRKLRYPISALPDEVHELLRRMANLARVGRPS